MPIWPCVGFSWSGSREPEKASVPAPPEPGSIGQSSALAIAEAIAPCVLWLDEIEKAIGGHASSAATDSGVTLGMVGTLLTWMQEFTGQVLVMATCNDYQKLPAEFTRAGRFDERFFVDLPSEDERYEIAMIHLRRYVSNEHVASFAQLLTLPHRSLDRRGNRAMREKCRSPDPQTPDRRRAQGRCRQHSAIVADQRAGNRSPAAMGTRHLADGERRPYHDPAIGTETAPCVNPSTSTPAERRRNAATSRHMCSWAGCPSTGTAFPTISRPPFDRSVKVSPRHPVFSG
ncbi:MAG: AAA family ATPase [Nitrospirae bacterium]|nr:MAG: AAA family ATPase [Nitrospirota bacterium]